MVSAIIVAAGKGSRMGCKKQFMEILGAPLISYTLRVFENSAADEIILVTAEEDIGQMQKIAQEFGIKKLSAIVAGGKERSDSVVSGLRIVKGDYVLIHDGARPFVTIKEIEAAISEVKKHDAVCLGFPVKDTIKITDDNGYIKSTPDRSTLFAAATPQCFRTDIIRSAYKKIKADGIFVTDDCSAAEICGVKVKILPCSYENIKITTAEDVQIAEAIIKRRSSI